MTSTEIAGQKGWQKGWHKGAIALALLLAPGAGWDEGMYGTCHEDDPSCWDSTTMGNGVECEHTDEGSVCYHYDTETGELIGQTSDTSLSIDAQRQAIAEDIPVAAPATPIIGTPRLTG